MADIQSYGEDTKLKERVFDEKITRLPRGWVEEN